MEIYCCHTDVTQGGPYLATQIALLPYKDEAILLDMTSSGYNYPEYFKAMWANGKKFINVEQDVVFWDGALEALWDCTYLWCAYGYRREDDFRADSGFITPYLGCVKFSVRFIELTKDVWQSFAPNPQRPWEDLDFHLMNYTRNIGIKCHQHYPCVINANPAKLTHTAAHARAWI